MSAIRLYVLKGRHEEGCKAVFQWWRRLIGRQTDAGVDHPRAWSPSVRAELRRARSMEEVVITEGFRLLWFELPPLLRRDDLMPAWACVAAALAEVREDDPEREFAAAMGAAPETGGDRPRVSELRFAQLQRSPGPDDFFRRIRRTVRMLGAKVNVVSLADGILHWHREAAGHRDHRPQHRLAVRWANAYYETLAPRDRADNRTRSQA